MHQYKIDSINHLFYSFDYSSEHYEYWCFLSELSFNKLLGIRTLQLYQINKTID
jgi:hypothetical protein